MSTTTQIYMVPNSLCHFSKNQAPPHVTQADGKDSSAWWSKQSTLRSQNDQKPQNPHSCISDKLGFVQTAFLGMVVAYAPHLKVGFGFF